MIKTLLLQASTGGANYTQFIMLAGMVAIFYFFFIRPQQKKQKDQKKFIEAIKKGDFPESFNNLPLPHFYQGRLL